MNKNSSTAATRQWAVRWVLLSLLAVGILLLHAPHSAHAASATTAPTVHSTSAYISAVDHPSALGQGTVNQSTKTAAEPASSLAAGVGMHDHGGDNCSCCPAPATIAVRCEALNTGQPQQHGPLPRALDEDAFVTPGLALSGHTIPRGAPPSLAELSLLRI